MTNPQDLSNMIGRTAVDAEGNKLGKIGQVYLDDATGQPEWVTVSTGLFGTKESFAPLYGSSWDGDNLRLTVPKDLVKDAPSVDADGHLDDNENDALFAHYQGYLGTAAAGQSQGNQAYGNQAQGDLTQEDAARGDAGGYYEDVSGGNRTDVVDGDAGIATGSQRQDVSRREDVSGEAGVVGRDTSGPTTDDAMTRSEERLNVGTERVEAGRARLRKHIVTENVSTTVPVSHEEVRVEREPITDANRDQALSGPDLSEEEHEVTLHAEQPVVSKETVPVERVRLSTETVTEEQTVSEQVRKEQIDDPQADNR